MFHLPFERRGGAGSTPLPPSPCEIRVKLTGYNFGRWVCIVTVDGEDLAEWIKENKLTKADLCPEELN